MNLSALGSKAKEFSAFQDHAQKQLTAAKRRADERVDEAVSKLRRKEGECDDLLAQVGDLDRAAESASRGGGGDSLLTPASPGAPSPAAGGAEELQRSLRKVASLEGQVETLENQLDASAHQMRALKASNASLSSELASSAAPPPDPSLPALVAELERKLAASAAAISRLQDRDPSPPSAPPETSREVESLTLKVERLEGAVKEKVRERERKKRREEKRAGHATVLSSRAPQITEVPPPP